MSALLLSLVAVAAPADCDNTYDVPVNPLSRRDFPDEPFVDAYTLGPQKNSRPGGRIVVPNPGAKGATGTYPTAWIVHGLGFDYEDYTELQEHLAHVGIASVSIDTNVVAVGEVKDDLTSQITLLHGANGGATSDLASHLDDRIALVGHSLGGGAVLAAADAVAGLSAVDLYSVVALAPNTEGDVFIDRDQAQGLLVILGSDDADSAVNTAINSGFRQYDLSGDEASFHGMPEDRFTKSMVYVDGAEHPSHADPEAGPGLHREVVHAYTVSYLLWSLKDEQEQHVFFKQGQTLDGSTDVQLQWTEPTYRSVLDNFENASITNTMGGINSYLDVSVVEGPASSTFSGSPHATRVLDVTWSATDEDPQLIFDLGFPFYGLADHRDLTQRRYLSMRVGQAEGTAQTTYFHVVLQDGSGATQSRWISDFGTVRAPFDGAAQTNAPMETLLIPLCAYDELDLSKVVEVRLVFDHFEAEGHIQLDSLEFID